MSDLDRDKREGVLGSESGAPCVASKGFAAGNHGKTVSDRSAAISSGALDGVLEDSPEGISSGIPIMSPSEPPTERMFGAQVDESVVATPARNKRSAVIAALCAVLMVVAVGFVLSFGSPNLTVDAPVSSSSAIYEQVVTDDAPDAGGDANADGLGVEGDVDALSSAETSASSEEARGEESSSSSDGTLDSKGASANVSVPAETPKPAPAPAPTRLSVSVYIDSSKAASAGYSSCMASTSVSLAEGSTVYDALCATGVAVSGGSSYVTAINGLAEKQLTPGSGWMYSVNGVTPMIPAGGYVLSDGDSVRWYYVV